MCPAIQRPVERNLQHPVLHRAFLLVEQEAFPMQVKEALLDHILGLAPVPHHAESNSKDQAGIPVKQNFQGRRIVCLNAKHYLFIAGKAESCEFWRCGGALLAPGQGDGKRKRASLRRSTHGLIPSRRPVGDASDNTTVAPENFPDEAPMVSRQYTNQWLLEKFFRYGLVSLPVVQHQSGIRII